MILANVFLSVAMFLNSINIVNFNDKSNKNQLSVEKNDILTLKFEENSLNLDNLAPKYFLDAQITEMKCKGLMSKSFEKNFDEFYTELNANIKFLEDEIERLKNNSQAFTSEYIFHRKNHLITEIESLRDKIEEMSLKQKRKLLCYEYRNNEMQKYGGFLGFSVIYNDKDNPFLIGTIVMPEYIGKLEPLITNKSISLYRERYKNLNDIHTEPLSYFDKYFLNTAGFK